MYPMWTARTGTVLILTSVVAAPCARAQETVAIDLAGLRLQHGLNQSRSSSPNTISPAFRYRYDIDAMVRGSGGVLGAMFPSPTPLAQVMETLAPGSSQALHGQFDNCPGTHPTTFPPQTSSGSTVILGVTVTYSATLSFNITAQNHATFSITNVVLSPSLLVGSLIFDSGTAVLTRVHVCPPNCDGSTAVPFLNVADFTCFLQRFAAGDPWANCDCSTTEPVLNVADFTCFLQRFAAGCSAP